MSAALSPAAPAATPDPGVLQVIGELASATARTAPPEEVRHAARRCLVDWLGVAIAGWDEPPAARLRLALGRPEAPAGFAGAFRPGLPADHAALVLGTASHALDYDDTDHVNLIHVSSTLFPALLALSARERFDGAALLDVFIAAY